MVAQSLQSVGAVDGTARVALLVVVVLLLILLAAIAALAVVVRRRALRPIEPAATPAARAVPRPAAPLSRPTPRPARPSSSPLLGAELAIATSGMVCPTCRAEYAGMAFCTRDARRLVPAEEMLAGGKPGGGSCVSCRRAFEPGIRRCPHDGGEVIPSAIAAALRARARRDDAPTGVIAKSCPACRERFDLAARYCGHDGTALVVVN